MSVTRGHAAALEPPPGPSVSPDDEERPGCESNDEREPEELDDDEDAMPPDGYPEDEEAADGEAGEEDDEAEEAAAVASETGDSLSELGEEQRPAEVNAELTVEGVAKLKVPELKLQLKWRGLSQTGNKPELVARLKEAVGQGWPVKATLPRSGRGRQASTGAAGSAGRPAANAARWKALRRSSSSSGGSSRSPSWWAPSTRAWARWRLRAPTRAHPDVGRDGHDARLAQRRRRRRHRPRARLLAQHGRPAVPEYEFTQSRVPSVL